MGGGRGGRHAQVVAIVVFRRPDFIHVGPVPNVKSKLNPKLSTLNPKP